MATVNMCHNVLWVLPYFTHFFQLQRPQHAPWGAIELFCAYWSKIVFCRYCPVLQFSWVSWVCGQNCGGAVPLKNSRGRYRANLPQVQGLDNIHTKFEVDMINIVRAARHLVKVVFFVSTRRRYANYRIFLWKCIVGQTTVVYEKFCEDWRIFHKVIALWVLWQNGEFRGPAPLT